jgi:hypothetical protein
MTAVCFGVHIVKLSMVYKFFSWVKKHDKICDFFKFEQPNADPDLANLLNVDPDPDLRAFLAGYRNSSLLLQFGNLTW